MNEALFKVSHLSCNGFPDSGNAIIVDFSLSVQPGEWWQITGNSGSGKSLLLRCLAGIVPAQAELELLGKPFQAYTLTQWRREILYLGSKPFPLADTLSGHFTTPFRWRNQTLPTNVAMNSIKDIFGISYPLDHSTLSLSDGERVRIAVANAILLQPKVLLLDETLGPLDPANSEIVKEQLHQLSDQHGTAILWVDHGNRLTEIPASHRVALEKP